MLFIFVIHIIFAKAECCFHWNEINFSVTCWCDQRMPLMNGSGRHVQIYHYSNIATSLYSAVFATFEGGRILCLFSVTYWFDWYVVRFPSHATDFFFSSKCLDQLWGPPSLLFCECCICFLGVKWPEHNVDCSPPSGASVKNEWSYTAIPPPHVPLWRGQGQCLLISTIFGVCIGT